MKKGSCHTAKSKEKMRIAALNRPSLRAPMSEATKKKISQSLLGINKSEEARQKMREVKLGKVVTAETKQKIRKANLGKVLSKETKQKIGRARLGKTLSEETKQKIREAKAFHVEIEGKTYSNLQDVATVYGVSRKTVSSRVKNPNYPTWKKV